MKGFINIGNTCYLNSGLQLIIRIKEIYNIINKYRNHDNELDKVINFFDIYYNDSQALLLSNSSLINDSPLVMDPRDIKNIINKTSGIFNGYNQEDSEEFINYFIDFLDEKCNKINLLKTNNNPIKKLLETTINKSIKCKALNCLKISNTVENLSIINLAIISEELKMLDTLDKCLIEFLKREKLDNDNKYFCENCNKLRIASKRLEIKSMPNNIIFSLKRYNRRNKNNMEVDMPLEWNGYNLQGIIYHSGGMSGGHYIYIGKEKNEWYMFNDSCIDNINLINLNQYKNYGYIYHYSK
jgi:ubiquitin carboxyl-terminal hydrolase 12/46